jgi:hypothetical protein
MPSKVRFGSPKLPRIYRLLLASGQMSARQVAAQLNLVPNAVYRYMEQMRQLGLVRQSQGYPAKYAANSPSVAMGWFLLEAQRTFNQEFGAGRPEEALAGTSMSFLRTRGELLKKTDNDVSIAKHEVNFMVSGLEVPAETILTYKKAIDRGVKIRVLIQKRDDISVETLDRWLGVGIEARVCPSMGIRMFVFDSEIVYLTSYVEYKKDDAFGLRFRYPPLAAFMGQVFAGMWSSSTEGGMI